MKPIYVLLVSAVLCFLLLFDVHVIFHYPPHAHKRVRCRASWTLQTARILPVANKLGLSSPKPISLSPFSPHQCCKSRKHYRRWQKDWYLVGSWAFQPISSGFSLLSSGYSGHHSCPRSLRQCLWLQFWSKTISLPNPLHTEMRWYCD